MSYMEIQMAGREYLLVLEKMDLLLGAEPKYPEVPHIINSSEDYEYYINAIRDYERRRKDWSMMYDELARRLQNAKYSLTRLLPFRKWVQVDGWLVMALEGDNFDLKLEVREVEKV